MQKILILLAGLLLLAGCSQKEVRIATDEGTLVLQPLLDNAIRVRLEPADYKPLDELVYVEKVAAPKFEVTKKNGVVEVKTAQMCARYENGVLTFCDADGNVLLREDSHRLVPSTVQGEPTYDATLRLASPEDEFLYGTGQFQDGFLNIRGVSRRLTQVNTQIALPFILSSKGYGLLWNNYGLTDFNPADQSVALTVAGEDGEGQTVNATGTAGNRRERRFSRSFAGSIDIPEDGTYALLLDVGQKMARRHYLAIDGEPVVDVSNTWLPPTTSALVDLTAGTHTLAVEGVRTDNPVLYWKKVDDATTFHSPVAAALDYTVFAGRADEAIGAYRTLTGPVPEMPDWLFGYIHCRERYDTQAEVLENARGFVERDIPVSVIVQDWKWWGDTGWNSMVFDKAKYPDPAGMVRELHAMDMKFMISVWSRVESGTALGDSLARKGYFIPGTEWVDYFNPAAARYYWERFRESMVELGIDAWWFDATEPDNDYELLHRRVADNTIPGEVYRNVYPLVVNRAMYEGFRQRDPDHMPMVLTRSAFAGSQRYGVITWSGDVNGDWLTLRRQITGGLGQMAAGLPWWTYDAGGFNRPANQYTDPAYQECMLRWIETSVFLPFMRVHGMSSRTEPWNYSPETERIYTDCIRLRYQLMPYILDCAKRVSNEGYTLMRPLVFDFPDDREALRQDCEYMFGPDYLVCPVTQPGVSKWKVYLPENQAGWEDFRDGTHYDGGQYVCVPVNLEMIPVFKRL